MEEEEVTEVTETEGAQETQAESAPGVDYTELAERLSRVEEQNARILGALDSIRNAQSVMVDMGAVIRDESDIDNSTADAFVPLEELDFTI